MQVNIREAKADLSKLIERAHSGEEIIIAKYAAGQIVFHKGWESSIRPEELDDVG